MTETAIFEDELGHEFALSFDGTDEDIARLECQHPECRFLRVRSEPYFPVFGSDIYDEDREFALEGARDEW